MTATNATPDKPAGRGLIILGFLLSTLLTGAVTCAVGLYNNAYQAVRAERSAQVDKFVQTAEDFDPIVRTFVSDESTGRLSVKTRLAVRDNLEKQRAALQAVRSTAPAAAVDGINTYEATLGAADDGIKNAHTVMDSRAFAQEAVHLAEQRDPLFRALRACPSLLLN